MQTAFKKIEISGISRQDLITLKLNTAINRAESKDIKDVNSAYITLEEFEEAFRYILKRNRAEEKFFQDYQDNDFAELRRELFG